MLKFLLPKSFSFNKSLLKFAFQIKNLIQSNSFHIYTIHPMYKKSLKIPPFTHVKLTMNFQFEIFIDVKFRIHTSILSLPRNFSRNFIQDK